MRKKLIIIAGLTACGKSALAVELALRLGSEVISADSMQVYKYMDIGTAKITEAEARGVRHHLIDEVYPDEEFSVAAFQKIARKCAEDIIAAGKTPIIVGGTGFYINALLYGNNFAETVADGGYREELYGLARARGNAYLHGLLRKTDPEAAEQIHENNVKRVVRALEFFRQTGEPISAHNAAEKARPPAYEAAMIALYMDRDRLYNKIDARVENMIKRGLIKEVDFLLEKGYNENLASMQGLGYKETAACLKGRITLEQAVADIKTGTRRYAKRQETWFKNRSKARFVDVTDVNDPGKLCESVQNIVYREIGDV